jgi:hypothetical protein
MSQVVRDVIEAEFAQLVQIVPTPQAPLLYGRDLSCVMDVTDRLDEVDENSVQGITESTIRRLSTRRGEYPDGGLPEDGEYGWSVLSLVSKGLTSADIRDAAGEIQQEVTKDDRIESASVTLTQVSLKELRILITITPAIPGLAPFDLNLVATPTGLQEAA